MEKPQVITWFKVYAAFMVLLYVLVAVFGVFLISNPDIFVDDSGTGPSNAPTDEMEATIMGVIYGGLGVVLAIAFAIGLFTPRKFWGWIYNLVLICIGLTSCCFWPATIPLLIFWIKDENREWHKYKPSKATADNAW